MAVEQFDDMNLQPLETPPLRVSRPVAACSRCRNAKIKCDGKLPACTSCEKNGRAAECTSTNDQFARGKERSYVSTLETRIDRLQARIKDAQARKPSVVDFPDETPVQSRRPSEQIHSSQRKPSAEDEVPTPTTGRRQKRKEVSAIDDLVSDFGFLSVNATARDFHGFTQAMSYARLILWSCSKDELPKVTSKALPSRNDANALVQFYLNNILTLLPAFDEAWLWTAVENVYSKGSRTSTALDQWMVRMVLAIANASMSRQNGDGHHTEGISHVCAALDYSEYVLHPGNVSGIQALLLLAEYAMLSPHYFDSWQLIGAASRAMTDLGYHQDPPRGSQMDRNRLELRRRVFYCIYILDRSTSLVQTRAFSFSDASANVKVPFNRQHGKTSISSEASASSPSPNWPQSYEQAADLVEFRKLQSEWYTELFQTSRDPWEEPYVELWRFCDDMRRWFDNLSPSTPQHMRQFFELDLLYSYVYVLSPSSRVPRIHQFAQKLIFEYCIRYTDLMLHLISDPAYTAPLTFYDAMRVYMTGRQFIDVLSHSIDMLLSGAVPPHPDVKPNTAPPPAVPVTPPPSGETVQRFNTCRAITCIKQTMDCMGRFGSRWGYMSWYQRYEHESKPMLENLEQRLHVLDETARARRVSTWSSSSLIPSSNGTGAYYSPPQSMQQGPTMYQQSAPTMAPPQSSYGDPQQTSLQMFQHQPSMPPRQQYPVQPGPLYGQVGPPQYRQPQQPSQAVYNSSYRQSSLPTAPGQQFAAWSGYGVSAGSSNLDEEDANLARAITYLNSSSAGAGRGSFSQPPPHRQSNYVASFEPLPRSLVAPDPTHISADENIRPDQHRHSSQYEGVHIPSTATLPPLSGAAQAHDPSMPPPPVPFRRSSMQDASTEFLQVTYPHAFHLLPSDPPPPSQSPRTHIPPRMRLRPGGSKSKDRTLEPYHPAPPLHPVPPAGEVVGACRWHPGYGYICDICSRICVNPAMHRVDLQGNMCTDFSGFTLPMWQEVHDAVAQDPARAVAEAEAIRCGTSGMRDLEQGQHQQQDFGHPGQAQVYSAEGVAGPADARPGGSLQAGQFTTAAQIQQWAVRGGQYQHEGQGEWRGQETLGPGAGAGMFF